MPRAYYNEFDPYAAAWLRWQHYADDLLRDAGFSELVDVVRGQREAA